MLPPYSCHKISVCKNSGGATEEQTVLMESNHNHFAGVKYTLSISHLESPTSLRTYMHLACHSTGSFSLSCDTCGLNLRCSRMMSTLVEVGVPPEESG